MVDFHFSENSEAVLIEISKHLIESQDEIWLRLKGNCMWPVVRCGDEVKIQKSPYGRLRFGDVAIFQTSDRTFHANTIFRNVKDTEPAPENYIGKVVQIRRGNRSLDMDPRTRMTRFLQALISPANPYGLGLPRTFVRKFLKRGKS